MRVFQVYVAIISNLITFPVNFIIAFLFKRSRRRNQQTRVGEAVTRMRQSYGNRPETPVGQNRDTHPIVSKTDTWGAQRYVDPLTPDVRPSSAGNVQLQEQSTTSQPPVKKIFLLPWWCTIIAWTLLFIAVSLSVAFVTFYGITFQNEKCTKWLTSLLISFFSSVLLTQPVKVLLMALFFAVLFKKPPDDDVDEEALEAQDAALQSDETWLHSASANRTLSFCFHYTLGSFFKYFMVHWPVKYIFT
jgi:polycystin 1L2